MTKRREIEYLLDQRNDLLLWVSQYAPAHLSKSLEGDPAPRGWRQIICFHTCVGRIQYHIQDKYVEMFNLSWEDNDWDGSFPKDRKERLYKLCGKMEERE